MSYFKSLKGLLNLRTLIVALIFASIVYTYYANHDWCQDLPGTLEKEIDLFACIEKAYPEEGYGGPDYPFAFICEEGENTDDNALFLPAKPESRFRYKGIPIHDDPILYVKFGILENRGEARCQEILFQVHGVSKDESVCLLSEKLSPYGSGRIRQMETRTCSLADFEGETVDLLFSCRSVEDRGKNQLLCAWERPRILSDGKRDRLKNIYLNRYLKAVDFLDLAARGPAPCRAPPADEKDTPLEASYVFERDFTPAAGPPPPGCGPQPSLVFYDDHCLAFPSFTLPAEGPLVLRFDLGLKRSREGEGGAEFMIRLDGEALFQEGIPSEACAGPWRERAVDLSRFAGETVNLSLAVRFTDQEPEAAAFGRPRLLVQQPVQRTFTDKKHLNLIVVNVDSLRSDCLGCYGSPLGLTPFIDRLAGNGVLFKDFITASPDPIASVATLFTGLYPGVHGAGGGGHARLGDGWLTVAECMETAGITTGAFVANPWIRRTEGFDRGFETFAHAPGQNARKVNSLFDHWLNAHSDFRFFAYLQYADAGAPWGAPGGLRDQYLPEALRGRDPSSFVEKDETDYLKGRYYGEVAYIDRRIEELVETVEQYGLLDKTVFVLTGTHGEAFKEHERIGHGTQLFEESIRVPLIVWGPKKIIGEHRIIEGMADNTALFASLAWLMRLGDEGPISPDAEDRAEALFPLDSRFGVAERIAFSQILPGSGLDAHAVMNWRYKLILEGGAEKLYDLVEDPHERHDRSGTGCEEQARLRGFLDAFTSQVAGK